MLLDSPNSEPPCLDLYRSPSLEMAVVSSLLIFSFLVSWLGGKGRIHKSHDFDGALIFRSPKTLVENTLAQSANILRSINKNKREHLCIYRNSGALAIRTYCEY